MTNWEYELMNTIRGAAGKKDAAPLNVYDGEIVQDNPLVISMLGGELTAQGDMLKTTTVFTEQIQRITNNGGNIKGLRVAVIGSQEFFAISLIGGDG